MAGRSYVYRWVVLRVWQGGPTCMVGWFSCMAGWSYVYGRVVLRVWQGGPRVWQGGPRV